MRIEAKAALLPLMLGWLLPTAAAQRIITDRSSPQPAPTKAHAQPAAKPAPGPVPSPSGKPAHKTIAHRPDPLAARLLDDDEGLQVIAAALGSHIRHASGDDCSQLVHEIYERAGFPYKYANSWELYDGTSAFHRVWAPHPGDLVVWQGHVGIVVSPKEHLFFSKLTSSGQDIASFDAPYWQERGHARFFRYLKPEDAVERAAARRPRRKLVAREVVAAEPAHSPSPGGFDGPPADEAPPAAAPAETSAEAPAPSPLPLLSRHPEPEQVRQAILQDLLQAAPALSAAQAPALSQPLIVFDDLRVERVRLDGDQGWAEVRIHQVGAVSGSHVALEKRTHRAFWSLRRRDHKSWEVVTPEETTYLPREAAVPVIAHQLAILADHPGAADAGAPQKKSLARFLSILLEP